MTGLSESSAIQKEALPSIRGAQGRITPRKSLAPYALKKSSTRALESLTEREQPGIQRKKTVAKTVAHIRESRKGVTLGGLKIKD
jgi:hypothetical protein